ncbi:hypothetical protein Tco_0303210 [Tanacetum coccineum]
MKFDRWRNKNLKNERHAPVKIKDGMDDEGDVDIDDPDISMEEYIQLIADKARGCGQTFNWETTMYGKVYCDDLDSFTDFETDFPAIVYNDASTSNQNVSSEPTTVLFIHAAIRRILGFGIWRIDSLYRPCCKEIDELVMVYSGKRHVLNSYGHSDASSTHFCSRTQIGESSRAKYQGSSSF